MPQHESNAATPAPLTSREEVAAATEYAFDDGPAKMAELLESAVAQRATPATIAALQRLPAEQIFTGVEELWP